MEDLGVLDGDYDSYAWAINDLGQVAGNTRSLAGDYRSFIWSRSTGMVEIPQLAGAFVEGMNDSGTIVGYKNVSGHYHAFVWDGLHVIDIGTLPNTLTSIAHDVNNLGVVVGNSDGLPFRWIPSSGLEELPLLTPATSGDALAINDFGFVAGVSGSAYTPATRAIRWRPTNQIDSIACCGVNAKGISASGHVTGTIAGGAFLWSETEGVTAIAGSTAAPPTQGIAINAGDQITGNIANAGNSRVFLWSKVTGVEDLGTLPGTTRCFAKAINDLGEIIGFCD